MGGGLNFIRLRRGTICGQDGEGFWLDGAQLTFIVHSCATQNTSFSVVWLDPAFRCHSP